MFSGLLWNRHKLWGNVQWTQSQLRVFGGWVSGIQRGLHMCVRVGTSRTFRSIIIRALLSRYMLHDTVRVDSAMLPTLDTLCEERIEYKSIIYLLLLLAGIFQPLKRYTVFFCRCSVDLKPALLFEARRTMILMTVS